MPIFRQWREVYLGRKTQTRRIEAGDEPRYKTGREYAVVPKRGMGGILLPPADHRTDADLLPPGVDSKADDEAFEDVWERVYGKQWRKEIIKTGGWRPLKIVILATRRQPLQDIDEYDARAEGVGSVDEYRELWDSINKRPGTRWVDNPMVRVYTFKVRV